MSEAAVVGGSAIEVSGRLGSKALHEYVLCAHDAF